ncbi:MAG: hypothetical protein ACN4GW_10765 [Desulforhopalus sp.]
MVGIEILVRISPEKRGEFLQSFNWLTQLDELNERRMDSGIFEQVNNPNNFLWVEHWYDEKSLASYCEDNKFYAMMGAIGVMGQLIHKRAFTIIGEGGDE